MLINKHLILNTSRTRLQFIQLRSKKTKSNPEPNFTVPPPPTESLLKLSNNIFNQPSNLSHSLDHYNHDTWPNKKLPEIAFVGVKGTGKSTLITGLLQQKKLPRTSRAQKSLNKINIYNANDRISLVDFPSYTYRERDLFDETLETYLQADSNYSRMICMVIEAKMELNHYDHLILQKLDSYQVPYQVVLTKMDKYPPQLWPNLLDVQESELCVYLKRYGFNSLPHIILTSSLQNKTGFELLKCSILDSVLYNI